MNRSFWFFPPLFAVLLPLIRTNSRTAFEPLAGNLAAAIDAYTVPALALGAALNAILDARPSVRTASLPQLAGAIARARRQDVSTTGQDGQIPPAKLISKVRWTVFGCCPISLYPCPYHRHCHYHTRQCIPSSIGETRCSPPRARTRGSCGHRRRPNKRFRPDVCPRRRCYSSPPERSVSAPADRAFCCPRR